MADSIAVLISSDRARAADTALNLVAAAVAMDMEAHVYFTGDAIVWVGRSASRAAEPEDADEVRQDVAGRLREMKDEGVLRVYACTRAMKAHDIPSDSLAPEVDMPAGFAYFLGVMEGSKITVSF
jgi:peroxiredoxin family protein